MAQVVERLVRDQEAGGSSPLTPTIKNNVSGLKLAHGFLLLIVNDKIVFQRGYWDKLSFLKQHGLPIE